MKIYNSAITAASILVLPFSSALLAQTPAKPKKKTAPATTSGYDPNYVNPKMPMDEVKRLKNIEVVNQGISHPTPKLNSTPTSLNLEKKMHIAFIGGGLGSRMNLFNEFETELHRRYPEHDLYIRNMCFEGDTPAFRPHPSRSNLYAIPNGNKLVKDEYNKEVFKKGYRNTQGHYETPDQWLNRHNIDTVIGFFGYTESFDGLERIDGYKEELRAFIKHSLKQNYNSKQVQLAIVGPAAFEDLSASIDLPNGNEENKRLSAYSAAMAKVCEEEGILFVNSFETTAELYKNNSSPLTSNGHNLNAEGYKKFSPLLASALFGKKATTGDYKKVHAKVKEKNRIWLMDYKTPNGVHVWGQRFYKYGDENYPFEIRKIRQMVSNRDADIWATNKGLSFDLQQADLATQKVPGVPTNSAIPIDYKSGKEIQDMLKVAEGYKVELFASEEEFPDLQNPSQMAFDNEGRLWVGCMPSYPHYKIGDPAPNDKIIILEDTDGDYKADKQTTFVENIHIPMGFEITEKGVFVSLGNNLVLIQDTDGDSKADKFQAVLSGFDDHDTHHAISSFCADPSGAIYMGEGIFSHSNVETPYGAVRGTHGGFYRYNPSKMRLERTAQYNIPNPWGIAFNDWGQNFFLHTSGTAFSWMQRTAVKPKYGRNLKAPDLLNSEKVRPTSGVEFISSRHFPDEVQGDVLICNNIGYLGCKQHQIIDDPQSHFYHVKFRQDLFFLDSADYQHFRPVDLEFAPDGSLYFVDWSNILVGHMQHNARDPKRDHTHGRVYRVTYPSRELVTPAKVAKAPLTELLNNLKEPEIRTRYRTRRELRGRDTSEVLAATKAWVKELDPADPRYEHHTLEALWVTWGINKIDTEILELVLKSKNYKARAAAVRAIRYNADKLTNTQEYLTQLAQDSSPQVKHEVIIAASWLKPEIAAKILTTVQKQPLSAKWSQDALKTAWTDTNLGKFKGISTNITDNPELEGAKKGKAKWIKGKGRVLENKSNLVKVLVNCVPKSLAFDFTKFNIKLGQEVEIIFQNPDDMQHNLVVCNPGTEQTVAMDAIKLVGPKGLKMHYVPKNADVVKATKLLNKEEVEVIKFKPTKKGIYKYICSFPGHAQPMQGDIVVE